MLHPELFRPSTLSLSCCQLPSGSASHAPPVPPELLSERHLLFLRFAPENRLLTSCLSACVLCQPSPPPLPPGLGSATEERSARRSRFDPGRNYGAAMRPLSRCLVLSIKITLPQKRMGGDGALTCRKIVLSGSDLHSEDKDTGWEEEGKRLGKFSRLTKHQSLQT